MSEVNLKRYVLITIGLLLIVVTILVSVKLINNSSNQKEVFESEWGSINPDEETLLIENLEKEICIDGKYPDYYGGYYSKNYNIIILLTEGSEDKEAEIRNILGQEESVYVKYVPYSLNDLEKAQQEFGERYQELYEEGDKRTIELLNEITGSGVYVEENEVTVKIKNYSWWKVRKFKKLFGDNEVIHYTEGGNVAW